MKRNYKQIVAIIAVTFIFGFTNVVHHVPEEPPFNQQIGWDTEEIPGGLQFYYDTDGDGKWDLAFSHIVIESVKGGNCYNDHPPAPNTFMFTNCPTDNPVGFVLLREPWYVREWGGSWRSLFKTTFQGIE